MAEEVLGLQLAESGDRGDVVALEVQVVRDRQILGQRTLAQMGTTERLEPTAPKDRVWGSSMRLELL